jgi:hypothetical protein
MWEYNIKTELNGIAGESDEKLYHEKDKWNALLNMVINVRVS